MRNKPKDVLWFPKPLKKIPEPGKLFERNRGKLKRKIAIRGMV